MIQAGLRVENTNTRGASTGYKQDNSGYVGYDSGFDRHYIDFFPSGAITWNKNPRKQWSVNYSRRIDRPAYQDLNQVQSFYHQKKPGDPGYHQPQYQLSLPVRMV